MNNPTIPAGQTRPAGCFGNWRNRRGFGLGKWRNHSTHRRVVWYTCRISGTQTEINTGGHMLRNRKLPRMFLGGLGLVVGFVVATAQRGGEAKPPVKPRPKGFAKVQSAARGMHRIKHAVFIVKENRTFDNYFGTFPGADGATSGTISTGGVIPLGHTPDRTPRDISHSFQSAVKAIDGGAMDQFDVIPGGNQNGDYLAYTQLTENDIPNYFALARYFTLGDTMFSSLSGPSFPNHLYTVGAQSGGAINNPNQGGTWGCDSDDTTTVQVMDSDGNISRQFPCFDFATLADTLASRKLSWRYYAPGQGQSGIHLVSTRRHRAHSAYQPVAKIRGSYGPVCSGRGQRPFAPRELGSRGHRQRTSAGQQLCRRELDGETIERGDAGTGMELHCRFHHLG